tara:strand:+ start:3874 stop:5136 length:1263 start_codon:yes stop_codon:yes gene_type:complete
LPITASAQQSLYLRDGRTLEGTYAGDAGDRLNWQMEAGSTSVPMNQVDYIDFPAPRVWEEMMTAFGNGDYAAAAVGFAPVSNNKTRATYYPAPGNFANLAERRLLDCYRKTRNWGELRYVFMKSEWEKLPIMEREIRPVMAVWAAIGGEEWDQALKLADEAERQIPGMANELGFARAMAYKGKGDSKGAVIALAEAFGPHPGMDRAMAEEALAEAANILREDPERQPELQALVHIYAGLFGQGKLWDGAPPLFQELLAKAIDTGGAPTTSKRPAKTAPTEGQTLVRYVQIRKQGNQRWGLSVGEVEVMSGGYNIAKEGEARLSDPRAEGFLAEYGIDGKTDKPGHFSATRMSVENPYWELDLGEVVPVDSVVVWSAINHAGEVADSLGKFQLKLFDGDRQEVFARNITEKPNPKIKIPVL